MCHGDTLSGRLSNTEQSSVFGVMSGSLICGDREPDGIVIIVPKAEVFLRPEDGGKQKRGRVKGKGSCLQDKGSNTGIWDKV